MRPLADAEGLRALMRELGRSTRGECRVYFTGGATAVLVGWRASTLDADIKIVPDSDEILRAVPAIKERLRINVELAAPSDFIPELPGWQERSAFIAREGSVSFFHYDPYSQALAKIERGHSVDRLDVAEMISRGLVLPEKLVAFFEAIAPAIYRYPAIDEAAFRAAVYAATTLGPPP